MALSYHSRLEKKIESERRKIVSLDEKLRNRTRPRLSPSSHHHLLEKQIRSVENRLVKALETFNQQNARNKQSRQQIDSLRKERVTFDRIYRKLEKKLHEKQKEIEALVSGSTEAFRESRLAAAEMSQIREAIKMEKIGFIRDFHEANYAKKIRKKTNLIETKPIRSKTEEVVAPTEKEEESLPQVEEKQFGIEEMKEKIAAFQEVEESNFSLVKKLNDAHAEIDQIKVAIQMKKIEIEKCFKREKKSVAARLSPPKSNHDDTLRKLRAGVLSLSKSLRLDVEEVTESNLLATLEKIELKTTTILPAPPPFKKSTQKRESQVVVIPPAIDDYSSGDESDDDESSRPLARKELFKFSA